MCRGSPSLGLCCSASFSLTSLSCLGVCTEITLTSNTFALAWENTFLWLWMEEARGGDEKWKAILHHYYRIFGGGSATAQKKVLFEKKVFRFRPLENRMINLAQGIILWMLKGIHLSFRFHPVIFDCVREWPRKPWSIAQIQLQLK